MEHAPYSPVASTSRQPYIPDSPFVPTSDIGEREEEEAFSGGEGYWIKRNTADARNEAAEQSQRPEDPVTSDDELSMSPMRPQTSTDDELPPPSQIFAKSKQKRTRSPSPTTASSSSRTSPPVVRTSLGTSPPSRKTIGTTSSKKQRLISPVESDDSLETLKAITRPKPARQLSISSPSASERQVSTPPRRSPTPRRSPSPADDFPVLPPSPVAGRSLRNRTAAQLRPFSTEQFRYQKSLLKNGWAGAVVAGPKAVELSAEELRRKKLEQAGKKKDDLGGWLVEGEEEGAGASQEGPRRARDAQPSTGFSSNEDESEDGLTLLEREARRKERMGRETEAGLGINREKKARTKGTSPRRKGPSRIDDPERTGPNPIFVKKLPRKSRPERPRAESEPPSSSPGIASRGNKSRPRPITTSNGQRPPTKQRNEEGRSRTHSKSAPTRADSEPPASSPARPRHYVSGGRRDMAKPSKSVHARQGRIDRNALDADILNLRANSSEGSDSDDVQVQSLDGESEVPSEVEEEEEEPEGSEAEEGEEARRTRFKLDNSRRKALTSMLPKSFFKKAQEDLKLMERERAMGIDPGDDLNSGDEEIEEKRRNKAKVRRDAKMLDQPMRLDGDAFTDESGEEPDRTDSEAEQEEQEEIDAVSAWQRSFAPKRGRGGQEDDDIVDRFLKRARKSKKGGRTANGARNKYGKITKKVKGKERTKDGSKEMARREGRDGRDGQTGGGGLSKPHRRPARAVQLDTDRSIFVFAGLRNELDDKDIILPPVVANPRIAPLAATTESTQSADNSEIWAIFGKFTLDFGIRRLPPGVQFALGESFVRNGHLYSLIHPSSASLVSTFVYGISLDSGSTPEAIETVLPTLTDAIYDSISNLPSLSDEQQVDPLGNLGRALRFLGNFVSTKLVSASSDTRNRFGSTLATQLDHLQVRIDNVKVEGAQSRQIRKARIVQSWYSVDLTARLGSTSAVGGDSRRLSRFATNLVRLLLQHGIDRSLENLKKVMQDSTSGQLLVSDVTIEAWLGLISLATRSEGQGETRFDESDLWNVVLEETVATLPSSAKNGGPVAGEVLSITTMFLCAVSQFSPSGISSSKPRLGSHWPIMLRCLDSIKASTLSGPEHVVSSTAMARRDRYLSTLFARCLVFVERWDWKVQVNDDLLTRLFGLVAARRLSNLFHEHIADFPAQLVNLDKFGSVELESSTDTAFSIFLKLVVSAVNNLPDSTDAEKRKRATQLTRLSVRLAPMSTDWTGQATELTKSDSILVNHYSLLLTLAILHPAQAGQKVEQASKLLDFAKKDEEARKATVRAIRYWALAFRHFDLPLAPLLDWLAKIVSHLTTEYLDIEKQRRVERNEKSKEDLLWPRALLITMSLRLVQDVMRWKKASESDGHAFPDSGLLHPAWTSNILQSALALDPMIGREVLKTIDCFLDLRSQALQAVAPPPADAEPQATQQESQDDYGMDEFDFNDPALDALLGGEEVAPPRVEAIAELEVIRAKDKTLASTIKTNLVASFFSLIGRVYGGSLGTGPKIGDRSSYANDVVESWTRCIAILVSHGIDKWSPYLRYGDHSFQRIGDGLGKLDTGLFLAIQILHHEPTIYSDCMEEILSIWFSTIVSSKLTSQHILTELLLNVDTPSPLFDNAPFDRAATSHLVEVEQLELLDKRIDFLRVIFANAARIASFQPSATAPFAKPLVPKPTVMRFLRDMLSAMRTYFSSIRDEIPKRSYAKLVKEILDTLTSASADSPKIFNESNLPDIKILRAAIAFYL